MTDTDILHIIKQKESEIFYLTGDIEKYGTGFLRVKQWFKDYPEIRYLLTDLEGFMKLKIETIQKHDPVNDPVNDPANDPANDPVNTRQKLILKLIKKDKYITRTKLAEINNVSVETIKRDIRKLKQKNLIKRIGSDKTGFWQIIDKQS